MMVTFVSQCEKNSLKKTRRVLDAFANRIGGNTWQTVITNDGLQAVKKMLRQTASKSTAVSCHWIRSRSRSQFLWVVGNKNRFDDQGIVPVNSTQQENKLSENNWHNIEVIALLSSIAGFFHDFGKANALFQKKLDPKNKGIIFEPYRHEWVSLRLFQAFIGAQTDQEWLQALINIDNKLEQEVLKQLEKLKDPQVTYNNPLSLPEESKLAKVVAWLIVSHHRLPVYPASGPSKPEFKYVDQWLDKSFDPLWNSTNSLDEWDKQTKNNNWIFPSGTPFKSVIWQTHASELAEKALKYQQLFKQDWFEQRFTMHMSRLALMLSDHYYSSKQEIKKIWQDRNYQAYANTDIDQETKKKYKKQKLDEHNIGVAKNAYNLVNKLSQFKYDLLSLKNNKEFKKRVEAKDRINFGWQDKAFDLSYKIKNDTRKYGFFGINMASTGKGKTRSNARIMYALADEKLGCRFSVALGLRTLTLQSGDALAKHLKIDKKNLAVLAGSQAVKQLHELNKQEQQDESKYNDFLFGGSESKKSLFDENYEINYEGVDYEGVLLKWTKHDTKLNKLIQAPVLVSTVDYLIPATEGIRGGRQIAPMLRLFTSDLVLDEPDDFGLEDLPALCRLVNWAGMLGARVLLSTATMPPALAYALFEAYQAGRKDYTEVNGEIGQTDKVCCAWFDEFNVSSSNICDIQVFRDNHTKFVDKRIGKLSKEKILRKANLLTVDCSDNNDALEIISTVIHQDILRLHNKHHQTHNSGKQVSIGIVRMANINPLVAVAKKLFSISPQTDHRIHYCVYHSQYPLAIRSHIELKLDAALTRHNEEDIWLQKEIKLALENYPEKNLIFVVLATSVAEVGRDHDYDWAIAEPSSMRSLIQLAGRIQRHRKKIPETENMLILSKNYKALKMTNNKSPAYNNPGFESKERMLVSHNLEKIFKTEQYQNMNATPRIKKPQGKLSKKGVFYCDFVQLEQWAFFQCLLGSNKWEDNAKYWWDKQPTWCAELQRQQPFRRSAFDAPYCLYSEEEGVYWTKKDETSKPATFPETDVIKTKEVIIEDRNQAWLPINTDNIYSDLSKKLGLSKKYVSQVFGELRLREDKQKVIEWCYNPILGVYCE